MLCLRGSDCCLAGRSFVHVILGGLVTRAEPDIDLLVPKMCSRVHLLQADCAQVWQQSCPVRAWWLVLAHPVLCLHLALPTNMLLLGVALATGHRSAPTGQASALPCYAAGVLELLLDERHVMEVVGALENDPDSTQRQDHRGFLQKHALFKEVSSLCRGTRLCLDQSAACSAVHCGRHGKRALTSMADSTACEQAFRAGAHSSFLH